MSVKESFSDARIAYTFMIFFAIAMTAMGIFCRQAENRLESAELNRSKQALGRCSYALSEYINAGSDDERILASLQLENWVAELDCCDEVKGKLTELAVKMRSSSADGGKVVACSNILSILAASEYSDAGEVSEALDTGLSPVLFESIEKPDVTISEMTDSRLAAYVVSSARGEAAYLLGEVAGQLKMHEDSLCHYLSSGNLRAEFSKTDGTALRLIYLRKGTGARNGVITDTESLAVHETKHNSRPELESCTNFCGFSRYDFRLGEDRLIVVLDGENRIWALERQQSGIGGTDQG